MGRYLNFGNQVLIHQVAREIGPKWGGGSLCHKIHTGCLWCETAAYGAYSFQVEEEFLRSANPTVYYRFESDRDAALFVLQDGIVQERGDLAERERTVFESVGLQLALKDKRIAELEELLAQKNA